MAGACCGNRRGGGGSLVLTATEVTNIPLTYAIDVTSGSVDPNGIVTLTGTVTCNKRSWVYREGLIRQVRQDLFLARAYTYHYETCVPDTPTTWSIDVDTETSVVFGPGPAVLRTFYEFATDGWRDDVYTDDVPNDAITLQ